jgi:hypothetical protein
MKEFSYLFEIDESAISFPRSFTTGARLRAEKGLMDKYPDTDPATIQTEVFRRWDKDCWEARAYVLVIT